MDAKASRVLLIVPYLGGVGGVERYSRLLARSLSEVAERIQVFSLRGGPHEEFSTTWSGPTELSWRTKVQFTVRVLSSALRHRPDLIVSAHAGQASVALAAGLLTRRPYVILCHGREVWGRLGPIQRMALRRARGLWAVSQFTATILEKRQGVPPRRIALLPPAIPIGSGVPQRLWHDGHLLSVARLVHHKALDVLLKAVSRIAKSGKSLRLTIVGEGPERGRLELLIRALGIEELVQMVGRVSDDELEGLYESADIFVLVSRLHLGSPAWGEGFGIVYLEAAAKGLPVIAGASGGSAEAIEHGVTGILVPPDDAAALAEVISELVRDPRRAVSMGAAGRERIRREFSEMVHRQKVQELLDRALST